MCSGIFYSCYGIYWGISYVWELFLCWSYDDLPAVFIFLCYVDFPLVQRHLVVVLRAVSPWVPTKNTVSSCCFAECELNTELWFMNALDNYKTTCNHFLYSQLLLFGACLEQWHVIRRSPKIPHTAPSLENAYAQYGYRWIEDLEKSQRIQALKCLGYK